MREFYSQVTPETLKLGLRPDSRLQHDGGYLVECYGAKPLDFGLQMPTTISNPWSATVATSWPSPQLIRTPEVLGNSVSSYPYILVGNTNIYEASSTGGATVHLAYSAQSTGQRAMVAGGPLHTATFGNSIIGTNGNCGFYYGEALSTSTGTVTREFYVFDHLTVKSLCNYGGRLAVAGITSSSFLASSAWTEIWTLARQYMPENSITSSHMTYNENTVLVLGPAGEEALRPLAVELALLGMPTSSDIAALRPLFLDQFRKGMARFIQLPGTGSILCLKQLGQMLIAYCTDGIWKIQQDGFRRVSERGIAARGCVGGDDFEHVFVDFEGELWRLDSNQTLSRLGYKEYLSTLTSSNVVISRSYKENDYYISDQTNCYALTGNSLWKSPYRPTSLIEGNFGICSSLESSTFRVVLHDMQWGLRARKTIQAVEVSNVGVSNLTTAVQYRNSGSSYVERTAVSANTFGVAYPVTSAMDMRVVLTGEFSSSGRVDQVVVRWKLDDKRHIRGLYGDKAQS